MASKEIRWTIQAVNDKLDILEFWINRNRSKSYSEKLDKFFDEALMQVADFPGQGKLSDYRDIRIKLVRSYLIYYLVEGEKVVVIRLWDSRRDSKKFTL